MHTALDLKNKLLMSVCHVGFILVTSKRPMRCMEHKDAFIQAVYLVGDEDERGKSLSANVERGAGIFLQNRHSLLSIRQI